MLTVRVSGKTARLDDGALLGSGGEGSVYAWGGMALKIFHAPTAERTKKIAAFPRHLPKNVLGPTASVEDTKGAVVGYAMPLAPKAVDLFRLGQRRFREGTLSNGEVGTLFRSLRATLIDLHARNVVVGDLNDGNVLVADRKPWLIDADSMQFDRFGCRVAHERTLDPRLYGVNLSQGPVFSAASDWYAFAVLLFSTWLYVHPFGGQHPRHRTLLRRAEARASILRPEVKLPPAAAPFTVLSDELLDWFARIFEKDERAPLPESLLATRWSRCACGTEHARARCPACARPEVVRVARATSGVRAVTVLETRGRIVEACVRGRLLYLVDAHGELRRDDGSAVPREAWAPDARVVLAAGCTWIARGDRVACVRGGRVVEERSCGTFTGEAAFDANAIDAWALDAEWLVRLGTGERVGRVLEGQTWIRVGERFGFGVYRAGRVRFPFLFSTKSAGLRHITLAIPDGKILDMSADFDRDRALVAFVVDQAGRRVHAAFVVTESGRVVASACEPVGESPLASAHARCAAFGAILCATEEGLSLVGVDEQTGELRERKTFPQARPLLEGAKTLLAGPGGTVYVVRNQEILELSLV